jgi:hypothetical protein
MVSPERPLSEFARPEPGGEGSGLGKELWTARIRDMQQDTISRAYFEYFELGTTGLLLALEEAGIVPRLPGNPNPIDTAFEKVQYEQWWSEHQEEGETFCSIVYEHDEILDTLYLGAGLRRLTAGDLYRFIDVPSHSSIRAIAVFLRQLYEITPSLIESEFQRHGLLTTLEDAEILPTVTPLPLEWLDWNTEQRLKWKQENPEYEKRKKSLRYLHLGGIIDRLLDEIAD